MRETPVTTPAFTRVFVLAAQYFMCKINCCTLKPDVVAICICHHDRDELIAAKSGIYSLRLIIKLAVGALQLALNCRCRPETS